MTLKRFYITALILSSAFSWGATKISGTFASHELTKIYLYKSESLRLTVIDSSIVKKGKFAFKTEDLRGLYFVGVAKDNNKAIMVEEAPVEIAFPSNETLKHAVVTPKNPSKAYRAYTNFGQTHDQIMKRVNNEAVKAGKMYPQNSPGYNAILNKLRMTVDSLQKAEVVFFSELPNKYPCDFSNKVSTSFARTGVAKDDYFKSTDFTDPLFGQGDFIQRKISMYLMTYEGPNPQNVNSLFRNILSSATVASSQKATVYEMAVTNSYNFNKEVAKMFAKEYKKQFPNDKRAIELAAAFPPPPPGVSDVAPDLTDKSPTGETYSLSQLKGKVVLLDFWASWCGPCIREMPNVVAAYNKYHDKGFEVFSVSLDSDVNRWKGAIAKFNMNWPYHISDLKKWQSAHSRRYGVSGIPATYLIDQNGVIVAMNLRGAALEAKLAELFPQ